MPSASAKAKSARQVTPQSDFYTTHLFAFTPECDYGCTGGDFGVKGLSSNKGFLTNRSVEESPLPKAIKTALGNVIEEYDVDRYLQVNYEVADLQADIMKASMPVARIVIFCPPCVSAITTAVAMCRDQENAIEEWRVRVDHRLGCKCCSDTSSALARIEMMADTIADVESGNHWAKPTASETIWISYIDRAWLEQLLYNENDDSESSTTTPVKTASSTRDNKSNHDYAGVRQMLTFDGRVRSKTIAVILADVENGGWIINSKSFPVVERTPRIGEMYKLKRKTGISVADVERTFMGTFATKGALKRRREDSPSTTTSTKKPEADGN